MRRHGAATILALCAVLATAGCTRDTPAPKPAPKPGQLTEIFPAGLHPVGMDPPFSFVPHEPVALLAVPGSADVDHATGSSRGPAAAIYRLSNPLREHGTVDFFPRGHGEGVKALRGRFELSSVAREQDGTTWLIDNPKGWSSIVGPPRLLGISPDGRTATESTLTGTDFRRDRTRLTPLPDGRVGYLSRGQIQALPGDTGSVPALTHVERLAPTGGGGYLAATRPGPGTAIRLVRVDAAGTRTDTTLPVEAPEDPLRGTDSAMPLFDGSVVALTSDGHGGAYLAIARGIVDDSLGVDTGYLGVDTGTDSMVVHTDADGRTTLLLRGELPAPSGCPYRRLPAGLTEMDGAVGRITDLMVRGDQLWIAEAGCRRVLALQLDTT
ncbi:MAG: hypothetical protein JWN54_2217 [Mycobacterium sp.]|nr:hypothetical protein [Mycobacterium sp.]